MAFTTIENKPPRRGVAISATKCGSSFHPRLRFAPDVIDAMGWTVGDRLMLAYGTGKDKGKLQIKLDYLNGFKLRRGAPRDRSRFLICVRLGDGKPHKIQTAPHEISNGYLFVVLPDWARPTEPSAAE